MDKKTIIGIVLIFAIFVGFNIWKSPSKEEKARMEHVRDSVQTAQNKIFDSIAKAQLQNIHNNDSLTQKDTAALARKKHEELQNKLGSFAHTGEGENKIYTLENDFYKVMISSKGGRIASVELKNFQTFEGKPLILCNEETSDFGLTFSAMNRTIQTKDLYFQAFLNNKPFTGNEPIRIDKQDSLQFAMRLFADADSAVLNPDKYVEFLYTLRKNEHMMGFTIKLHGMSDVIASNARFVDMNWDAKLLRQEKNFAYERQNSTIFFKPVNDDVDYLKQTKDDENSIKTPLKWISFQQQFFSMTLIAADKFDNADLKSIHKDDKSPANEIKDMSVAIGLPYTPDQDNTYVMNYYFGPNKYKILKNYNLDLERQIPLGWGFFLLQWINRIAVIPIFNVFEQFNWNYGLIIIVMTLILKIVLSPIAYKSILSTVRMKVLKPEVDEIAAKYSKPDQAMDKQRATMALYKKAGVNPMAGCLPQLLQLPILIAMFRFFPASIELRQESFLWANDLSTYDDLITFPFHIPVLGDHLSIFAVLMTIASFLYTKYNSSSMMGSTNTMPGMKTMMYIMPFIFFFMFNSFSSALNFYYFLSTMITFGQQIIMKQLIDENKIHARIQENKKKVADKPKKAGWMERLEQRNRQLMAERQKQQKKK